MSNDQTNRSGLSPLKVDNLMSPSRIPDDSTNRNRQSMDVTLNIDKEAMKKEADNEVKAVKLQLDNQIHGLDEKLNLVLAKQEYEYLKGYNIYVKRKEKELRELIEKLNEKNSNNTLKDEKIINLEKTI